MDAYDIFKKLTKGLTFKNPVIGNKNKKQDSKLLSVKKEEESVLKEEIIFEDELEQISSDHNSVIASDLSDNQSENEDGNDLELVKGVKIAGKKQKKEAKEKSEDLLKKLQTEEQNCFRNTHGIKAVGRHIPAALESFSDLVSKYNVSQELVNIVTQCGYTEPTPVQRQALPCMLEDRQLFACAPTGSGKTAAFLLPLFHTLGAPQGGPRALILCPTRELAHQIFREALRLSASTQLRCSVVKSISENKRAEREATIRKSDIVISTPNRLCYLLNQDIVNIKLDKVKWLILDEADKMFEGTTEQQSDFRQQIDEILGACSGKQRRVALFSATHTPAVAKWGRRSLRGLINVTVGQRNAATDMVDQELLYCGNENGKLIAFRQLVQKGLKPPVLVFVQSKERAKQLFKELLYDGINVDVMHADRSQAQRDNVVRSFRVGRVWVLICTELMGRGIDFRGVSLVLNYDFPQSAITYIHRVGRAGRAGQRGNAITFFTQDDIANLRSIASVMKQSGCKVPEYMLQMKQNPNKRKRLMTKAPSRDNISTVLEKRPDKRKLENRIDNSTVNSRRIETKGTDAVNNAKNNKNRKTTLNKMNNISKLREIFGDNDESHANSKKGNFHDKSNKKRNFNDKNNKKGNFHDNNNKNNIVRKNNKSFVAKKVMKKQ